MAVEYPKIQFDLDVDFILDKLHSYKENPELMKQDCEKHGITGDPNQKIKWYCPAWQTSYDLEVILKDLLILYNKKEIPFIPGVIITDKLFKYKNHIDLAIEKYEKIKQEQIEEQKRCDELVREQYIERWHKEGCLCQKCRKGKMEYFESGLIEIHWERVIGGSIGGGIHVNSKGSTEYQFHYKKCEHCGDWIMTEWRKVPNFADDLLDVQPPFHKGNIITEYKMGIFADNGGYKSHTIKRW